ncbi:Chalcone synthase [Rhynchospora pubera]|uniref:chalcone synthase n=1 Tax=Rhynchospora pubera TaxID=906938 RepID=A0AAV8H5V8_9POAL|nr:Chalcone synthase [Rhynchospora pubera]
MAQDLTIRGRTFHLSHTGHFQRQKHAFTYIGDRLWAKSSQPNMNLKLILTVRSALGISRTGEDTDRRAQATVLAVGTAVPQNYIYQSDYPDYYFRVTNSGHLGDLKEKFTRICKATEIRKRYFHLTDEMIQDHPNIAGHNENSLDARNNLLRANIPELGKEAADKALQEWGQSRSKITHLIFHTGTGCIELPGPDSQLVSLLGLSPTVNRTMLYHNGCYAGGTALRLAKDIAENNHRAHVLVVCSEITASFFRGPSKSSIGNLVGQALFSDGAAAVIVGSEPEFSVEEPHFEIVSAKQTLIPGTADAISGCVTEVGLYGSLSPDVPRHIANGIGKCISDAFAPLEITDWNSLFWIVHPGGRKILDDVEGALKLEKDKFFVSRHVLAEYGNVASASVFFVMDEMRRRSKKEGKATTGEGKGLGVLLGIGPGLTIETVVLRAFAVPN